MKTLFFEDSNFPSLQILKASIFEGFFLLLKSSFFNNQSSQRQCLNLKSAILVIVGQGSGRQR